MSTYRFGLIAGLVLFVTFLAVAVDVADSEMVFGSDEQGEFAIYSIKKGESLWGTIVPKYTDRVDGPSVKEAVAIILKRNKIDDATKIRAGTKLKIPIEILSARYLPPGMLPRLQYQQKQQDLDLYDFPSKRKRLSRAVIIIDPGHGGRDTGAIGPKETYEDEVVYDIMCRLKRMLEQEAGAKVYVTLKDKTRGFLTRDDDDFPQDQDEYIQTSPSYQVKDTTKALFLRCHLANYIYRKALARNVGYQNVLFLSIHADELHKSLNGTMVYIPDSYLSKGKNPNGGSKYRRYREYRDQPKIELSYAERTRAEKLSRAFAETLCSSLRKHDITVHAGKPIRTHIVRSRQFVPAVLKYNKVPTKVLIEVVNLQNKNDVKNVRNYKFREKYARALFDGINDYFDHIGE